MNFVADEREAVKRLCGKRGEYNEFYHGTKADLKIDDLLTLGLKSNYGQGIQANYVYFTATMDAAVWGAELAQGDGKGRIYVVKPTGEFEDDPNLTDKKYPGNPTLSFRTREPLRIVGEVEKWQRHPQEVLQNMLDGVARAKEQGVEAINE
ncbi:MAG: NAD(+)--rifampin ADP-ribosyltransferase [Clostridiales Family XIII bacterium]|nr:NAD(+)--rifampin ADP-ribosyltransferase [Clostridiales Family XIII bacterium]